MFTREELLISAKHNPEALVDIILAFQEQVQSLTARIQQLRKNSRNSSKPPSSDGPAKPDPKSLRKRTAEKIRAGERDIRVTSAERRSIPIKALF